MSEGEFTILGFIEHIGKMGAEMVVAEEEALEEAAQVVEKEAKDSVGEYQPGSGPFAAWPELADATKADRVAQGYPENEPELRSGRMRDTIEHNVDAREAQIGSDDDILVMQEEGTSKMPPRSILGGAAYRKSDDVAEILAEKTLTVLTGYAISRGLLPISKG